MNRMQMKLFVHSILASKGKQAFIRKIRRGGKVLDLGCGNSSPYLVKLSRPDVEYWGIDVCDYNNEKGKQYADHYIISDPLDFVNTIEGLPVKFDAIISSHNIEHCNDPIGTVNAFCEKIKKGGLLYFSFPSEDSVNFPKRKGTLNFYDDNTHIFLPKYKEMVRILQNNGFNIEFSKRKYQPFALRIIGGVLEPISKLKQKVFLGTWAYWGFETKIWAKKN